MKDIEDNSIDLILCDLPYGVTDCVWDNIIPFNLLWEHYNRIIKNNGAIVLFSIQPFTTKLIHSNLKYFRYCWYWCKNTTTNFACAKKQPLRQIEDICVFYKHQPTYNPQGLIKLDKPIKRKGNKNNLYRPTLNNEYIKYFTNYPKHLLHFNSVSVKERYHPTQKPVELLEYLIKTYTNENEIVLDNCMGVGSTGIACSNTNRKFIGFELDKTYFNIAEKRIYNIK